MCGREPFELARGKGTFPLAQCAKKKWKKKWKKIHTYVHIYIWTYIYTYSVRKCIHYKCLGRTQIRTARESPFIIPICYFFLLWGWMFLKMDNSPFGNIKCVKKKIYAHLIDDKMWVSNMLIFLFLFLFLCKKFPLCPLLFPERWLHGYLDMAYRISAAPAQLLLAHHERKMTQKKSAKKTTVAW